MIKAKRGIIIGKRFDLAATTDSGLHIPNEAQRKPQYATVVAIGEGDPNGLVVGDVIFFDGCEDKFPFEGEFYHIIKHEDVAGLVEI